MVCTLWCARLCRCVLVTPLTVHFHATLKITWDLRLCGFRGTVPPNAVSIALYDVVSRQRVGARTTFKPSPATAAGGHVFLAQISDDRPRAVFALKTAIAHSVCAAACSNKCRAARPLIVVQRSSSAAINSVACQTAGSSSRCSTLSSRRRSRRATCFSPLARCNICHANA